jgi:hypothetical protein
MKLRVAGFIATSVVVSHMATAQPTKVSPFEYVEMHDPLSCGNAVADFTKKAACLGDAGSFQMARLSLAVEMFASALSAAGVRDNTTDIQKHVFADIGKFGVEAALIAPAMGLADVSQLRNSPFGAKSSEIFGKSIITMEYLHPGLSETGGVNVATLANMAGVSPMSGPSTFSDMNGHAATSALLDAFRIVGAPSDSKTVVSKLVVPQTKIDPAVNRNLLSDFVFQEQLPATNNRMAPVGWLLSSLASAAQGTGSPLDEKLFPNPGKPDGTDSVGSTFFGGAACLYCKDVARVQRGPSAPLLSNGIDVATMSAATPGNNYALGSIKNGVQLVATERNAIKDGFGGTAKLADKSESTQDKIKSIKDDAGCIATCVMAHAEQALLATGLTAKNFWEDSHNLDKAMKDSEDLGRFFEKQYKETTDCQRYCEDRKKMTDRKEPEKKEPPEQKTPQKTNEPKKTDKKGGPPPASPAKADRPPDLKDQENARNTRQTVDPDKGIRLLANLRDFSVSLC